VLTLPFRPGFTTPTSPFLPGWASGSSGPNCDCPAGMVSHTIGGCNCQWEAGRKGAVVIDPATGEPYAVFSPVRYMGK
jgi:hypothetical protein